MNMASFTKNAPKDVPKVPDVEGYPTLSSRVPNSWAAWSKSRLRAVYDIAFRAITAVFEVIYAGSKALGNRLLESNLLGYMFVILLLYATGALEIPIAIIEKIEPVNFTDIAREVRLAVEAYSQGFGTAHVEKWKFFQMLTGPLNTVARMIAAAYMVPAAAAAAVPAIVPMLTLGGGLG